MRNSQRERMNKINELINLIANTDRGFFNSPKGMSKFIEKKTTVKYFDGYTQMEITIPSEGKAIKNFCGGGTLQALVRDFKHFILTGKPSNGKHGYGGLYCTSWGYSIDGQSQIIEFAKEIGFLKKERPKFEEFALECYKSGFYGCGLKEALKEKGLIE